LPSDNAQSGARAANVLLTVGLLLILTLLALFVHGFHVGIEDDAIYLPAVKQHLNPSLYPHDSIMFEPQTRPTLWDELVAYSIRLTGVSVETGEFAWYLFCLFAFLSGCWLLMTRVFEHRLERLGAVAVVTALLTMPVAGVAIYIADQHLHPRMLATALVLVGASILLPLPNESVSLNRAAISLLLTALATLIHVQMAFYGLVFLIFLVLPLERFGERAVEFWVLLTPLLMLFQHGSAQWVEASRIKRQHYLFRWEWYEWIGIFGPIIILYLIARWAQRRNRPAVHNLALRVALLGAFGFLVTLVLTTPPKLERLTAYQPMRIFHTVYLMMLLLFGGLAAQMLLKRSWWRWVLLLFPMSVGMYFAQRDLFPRTNHIEWPGRSTGNAWVEAFQWVRKNTPNDAYFALDQHFMVAYGEDYHGFRALAERGHIADWDKDSGVACLFPSLAPRWSREVHALQGFNHFGDDDFRRLEHDFGVSWVVLEKPYVHQYEDGRLETRGFTGPASEIFAECPYQNSAVRVCKLR